MSLDAQLQWLERQQPEMLQTLKSWSECNSGSFNLVGLDKMAGIISEYAQTVTGAKAQILATKPMQIISDKGERSEQSLGSVISLEKNTGAPLRILFCGHYDTVFAKESDFQQVQMLDDNTLGGAGVADMKGGILVMLTALQAFEQSELSSQLDWQILLNADEEVGSHGSMPHLMAAAKEADIGLVYEPCMSDGNLAGARKGSGNFSLLVTGKTAHAGREYHLGSNAIAALSKAMTQLDKLNDKSDEITLNLAKIVGGGPNNVVPDKALCHFNIRVANAEQQTLAEQHLQQVVDSIKQLDGYQVELFGGFGRPAKPAKQAQQKLFDLVTECGQKLQLDLAFRATGGCCDGNNLLAAGLPNIDTLGVQGGNIHSDKEYMLIDSLHKRAQLSSLLLAEFASKHEKWRGLST